MKKNLVGHETPGHLFSSASTYNFYVKLHQDQRASDSTILLSEKKNKTEKPFSSF